MAACVREGKKADENWQGKREVEEAKVGGCAWGGRRKLGTCQSRVDYCWTNPRIQEETSAVPIGKRRILIGPR